MKPFENHSFPTSMTSCFSRRLALCGALIVALVGPALAANTDIASAPLFTATTSSVKPNIMYVLDDSGSMAWDYMPDDASNFSGKYGFSSSQCNGLAFNSNASMLYDLPLNADGSAKAAGSTSFLTVGNASSNTSNPRSLGATSIVSSGALSVTVTAGSRSSSWYFVGQVVTVYSSTNTGKYMVGTVTAWDAPSGVLGLNIAMAVGTGSLSSPVVANGAAANQVYYTYSGSQTAMDFKYPGNILDTSTTFYQECNSALNASPGNAVFTAHIVTPTSGEAQKYANWYAYYRTRINLMQTSLSRAFSALDDKFRVGFATISYSGITEGVDFLNVRDFGATQKATFYTDMFAATPGSYTPLRGAVSKIGRYYAKKISGQSYDPIQYSCQKNFTILSTDGYWNTHDETSSYKALDLGGTNTVGQQDGGNTARPMFDGNSSTTTTTKTWTRTATGTRTTVTPKSTVSTSASTTTSTVTTPHTTTGYALTVAAANPISSANNSCSWWNNGPCTITVTTTNNHGLSAGNSVTISGASPSAYNGPHTVATVGGSKTFTYSSPGNPGSYSSGGSVPGSGGGSGCPAGQGKLVTTVQTYNSVAATPTTTTTTTTTPSSSTTVYNITATTPMTEVITVVNGVQQSDTTTAGTTTTSVGSTVSGPTTVTDAPVVTTATSTSTTSSSSTTPVTSAGYPTTGATCVSTVPASTDVAGASSTSTSVPTVTTTGPTTTAGTAVSTDVLGAGTDGTVTTSTSSSSTGGASDTLADVAMYYYKTDLRNAALGNCTGSLGVDVCLDDVKPVGEDKAVTQHMTLFTISLGMSGTLQYHSDYIANPRDDYLAILQGSKNWPAPTVSSSGGSASNIDDLWHAAVNGRGQYFSATDPSALIAGLKTALNTISATSGASSAAATSTLQPVQGNNGVFIAQFTSSEWTGDLRAYSINTEGGQIVTSIINGSGDKVDTASWSASTQLTTSTVRNIYYFKSGSGLRSFSYTNLTADGLNGNVDNACSKATPLSQCATATGAALATLNSGANMVDFLRGQPHTEYRTRAHVLGDIVSSSPVYVGQPGFAYTENNYAGYQATQAANVNRVPTLYVGANDGMLHAIDATNGNERWAYIPSMVTPNMYVLGDQNYQALHKYFVDGTPTAGDIYVPGTGWKTILVGGLNAGGRGYYALDVTDPLHPVALWEFTNTNLGLSYGNPIITKLANGTWVVAFSSGYNNVSPGDGAGHLFVVDANTGALLKDISTGVGSAGSPSGLGRLNAWVNSDTDNTEKGFYAGDLLGDVWRFDVDGLIAPMNAAFKLAQLQVGGVPQPITVAPQLGEVTYNGTKYRGVFLGTGEYLGGSDVGNTAQQSVYAIKDTLSATSLGDVRGSGTLQPETLTTNGNLRTIAPGNPVNWAAQNGWYVDLGSPGERVNVDMQLAFGVLRVAGNVPAATATECETGSASWVYQLNVATGAGSSSYLSTMVAGLSTVQLANGDGLTIVTKTDASQPDTDPIPQTPAGANSARRSSWRELIE